MARWLPLAASASRSRRSLEMPERPRRPLFLLSSELTSAELYPRRSRKSMMAGSMSPLRVPIIRPSRGVKPMEVSMDLPCSMAVTEAPLPRWQVMTFVFSGKRFRSSMARAAT